MSVLCVLCTPSYIPDSVKNEFDVFRTFERNPQALRLLSYVFAVFGLRRFEVNKTTRPNRALLHAIRQSIIACQLINDSRLFSLYPVHPLFRHLNSPLDSDPNTNSDTSMTYVFSYVSPHSKAQTILQSKQEPHNIRSSVLYFVYTMGLIQHSNVETCDKGDISGDNTFILLINFRYI